MVIWDCWRTSHKQKPQLFVAHVVDSSTKKLCKLSIGIFKCVGAHLWLTGCADEAGTCGTIFTMIQTEEKENQRTKPVFNTISVFVHTQSFICQSTQVLCTWARIYLFLLDIFSAMPRLNLRKVVLSKPTCFIAHNILLTSQTECYHTHTHRFVHSDTPFSPRSPCITSFTDFILP